MCKSNIFSTVTFSAWCKSFMSAVNHSKDGCPARSAKTGY